MVDLTDRVDQGHPKSSRFDMEFRYLRFSRSSPPIGNAQFCFARVCDSRLVSATVFATRYSQRSKEAIIRIMSWRRESSYQSKRGVSYLDSTLDDSTKMAWSIHRSTCRGRWCNLFVHMIQSSLHSFGCGSFPIRSKGPTYLRSAYHSELEWPFSRINKNRACLAETLNAEC